MIAPVLPLTDVFFATWAAGIIEARGVLGHARGYRTLRVVLVEWKVGNLLQWRYGGSMKPQGRRSPARSVRWRWYLSGKGVDRVLNDVWPYCRTRRAEFLEFTRRGGGFVRRAERGAEVLDLAQPES